ncbi:MAG: cytoskeletal protein CcmA (bactofilin family) [Myxococcota bacterium]|jgi:cytoskeletal protein CcmA (bactofilin family)
MSHIAAEHHITGALRCGEDIVIFGRVQGLVESAGLVVIEAGAIVEANIHAQELVVRGVVVGEIEAVDGVEIAASGQILGDIKTRRMNLVAGGRISGVVQTGMELQPYIYNERGSTSVKSPRKVGRPATSTPPRAPTRATLTPAASRTSSAAWQAASATKNQASDASKAAQAAISANEAEVKAAAAAARRNAPKVPFVDAEAHAGPVKSRPATSPPIRRQEPAPFEDRSAPPVVDLDGFDDEDPLAEFRKGPDTEAGSAPWAGDPVPWATDGDAPDVAVSDEAPADAVSDDSPDAF